MAGVILNRQNILIQLETHIAIGDTYSTTQHANILTGIPILRSDNQSLPTAAIYIQNEQTVNDIYLQTVVSGNVEMPEVIQNELFNIANQCPTIGGEAVFKARSLFALVDPLYKFDDDLTCHGIAPLVQKKEEEIAKQVDFSLFPNPASDYIIIQLDKMMEGEVDIQLSDIYGKIVQKEKKAINGESTFIEIYNLTEGMYFCAISINGNRIGTKKFMLIK